ncbi:hypothetical protein ACHAXS_002503 [Conticribra weissflogii]
MGRRRSGQKSKRCEEQRKKDSDNDNIDDFERQWLNKRRKIAAQIDETLKKQLPKMQKHYHNQLQRNTAGDGMLTKRSMRRAECDENDVGGGSTRPDDSNSTRFISEKQPIHVSGDKNSDNNANESKATKEKERIQKLRLKKQLQKQRRKEKKAAVATALQTSLQTRQEARQQLLQQKKEFLDKKHKIRQFDAASATTTDAKSSSTASTTNIASSSNQNNTKTDKHSGFAPHPHPQNRHCELLYQDLHIGRGPCIRHRKNVTVSYTLRAKSHSMGKVLDAGKSFSFRFGKGEVIKGWDVGLDGMRVGGVRRLIVKSGMGYGKRDVGAGRGGDLFFEVELLRVAP